VASTIASGLSLPVWLLLHDALACQVLHGPVVDGVPQLAQSTFESNAAQFQLAEFQSLNHHDSHLADS
jgi:hypothetical protein